MASLSLYPQFETNLMSNRRVIELLLQLKSAEAHGKNYIIVTPLLVHHLLRNRLFRICEHVLHRTLGISNDLLTGLLGPYLEIRSLICFVRPELARAVRKSEGFVFLVRTEQPS